MNALVMVMIDALSDLIKSAPTQSVRDGLHVLKSAAADANINAINKLTAWRAVAGDPFNEPVLVAAISGLFPAGIPAQHQPPPPPVVVETPAEPAPAPEPAPDHV